jgi:hypothetical protein
MEHNEKQKNSSLWSGGSKTIPDITYKNPQAEDQGLKQELRTKEVTSKQNQELPHTQQARAGTRNHFTADGTNHGRPAHAPEKISEKWIWAEDWKPNMSCRENEDQGVQRSKAETTAQAANQTGEKIFAARGGKALGREPLVVPRAHELENRAKNGSVLGPATRTRSKMKTATTNKAS